jgi:HPt (histidine-containing phosphotransfer) domain-containing protein
MNSNGYQYCQPAMLFETVGDDREVFMTLIGIFESDSREKLDKMNHALAGRDFEQLGFLSHALKGTIGPLGAEALMETLLRIEAECERQECHADLQTMQEISRYIDNMRAEIADFVNRRL